MQIARDLTCSNGTLILKRSKARSPVMCGGREGVAVSDYRVARHFDQKGIEVAMEASSNSVRCHDHDHVTVFDFRAHVVSVYFQRRPP